MTLPIRYFFNLSDFESQIKLITQRLQNNEPNKNRISYFQMLVRTDDRKLNIKIEIVLCVKISKQNRNVQVFNTGSSLNIKQIMTTRCQVHVEAAVRIETFLSYNFAGNIFEL